MKKHQTFEESVFMSKIQGRQFYFGEHINREGPIEFEIYDDLGIGAKEVVTLRSKKILNEFCEIKYIKITINNLRDTPPFPMETPRMKLFP